METNSKLTPEQWDALPDWAQLRFADMCPYLSDDELREHLNGLVSLAMQLPAGTATVTWAGAGLTLDLTFSQPDATYTVTVSANLEDRPAARPTISAAVVLVEEILRGVDTSDPLWRDQHGIVSPPSSES